MTDSPRSAAPASVERETREELARTATRLRALLAGMLDAVVTIDDHGTVQEASDSVERVFGYRPAELVGENVKVLMPAEHREQHDEYLARYRETGETWILDTTREFEVLRKDGSPITCELSVSRVDVPGQAEPVFCGTFRDVTNRNRIHERETAMLRSLARIGESAAVLAHEIKNPITAVNVALRAVAGHLGEDDRVVLEELVGRMQKLEKLMRRTLTFARPLDVRTARHEVAELFEAARVDQGPTLEANDVELRIEIEPDCPAVSADAQLVDEVLTNLMRNAQEALAPAAGERNGEGGGTIRLAAGPAPDGQVWLAVEDDGPGIAEVLHEKLFEPFFTTKGMGTGLGLAICRKIAEGHGGSLVAGSSDLGGARFTLTLLAAP